MTAAAVTAPTSVATRRVLACSSAGGHFKQLVSLVGRMPAVREVTWLTYESGLADELLRSVGRGGDRIVHAPYAAPRDVINLARDLPIAYGLLRSGDFDVAVSTGAGIAVATLPMARAMGVRACYIESATRERGPSLSGNILQWTPGVELFTQHLGYGPRWRHVGSVHDGFHRGPDRPIAGISRAVVVLGTIRPFGFRRLLERLVAVLPSDVDVIWQTGATDTSGLPIAGRERIAVTELEAAIAEADVVIAHAGTGTALTAFEYGKCPVVVPRRAAYGEHVDDHQVVTAHDLARRDLAVAADVEELDLRVLECAAQRTIRRREQPPLLPV